MQYNNDLCTAEITFKNGKSSYIQRIQFKWEDDLTAFIESTNMSDNATAKYVVYDFMKCSFSEPSSQKG